MGSLCIRNGTVVTATDTFQADLFVQGEKIQAIGQSLGLQADQEIDAQGCYVFPGGIDAHTHMELPFMGTQSSDTFESGTLAGLHGGTTTIIDFAIQTPGDSLQAALNQWMEKASGTAVGDYAFHLAVTDFNSKTRQEIRSLIENQGVTSFKTFMAYKGALMIGDRQILDLMEEVSRWGGLVTTHAENGDLVDLLIQQNREAGRLSPEFHPLSRPPICEAEATGRVLDLAHAGGHSIYIVHLTCEEALQRVRTAWDRGQEAFVETCTQYLLLEDSVYRSEGFDGAKYVMSPPIRKSRDQDALWNGLKQNQIQVVATDHCPFCMDQKKMGLGDFSRIPNGAPGVEHRMELLFSEGVLKNRISLNQFVNVTSTAPARIFGLLPRKGTIAVGADADLVIFDPRVEHEISAKTHHMNCDYSLYEGWKVQGRCRTTVLRGTVVIDQGKELAGRGFGQYISRQRRVK